MSKRIQHIFEDGIEKKRCSRCKQYLPLDHYLYKSDRWDKLSNECIRCISIRNKRRANQEFNLPEDVETPEEIRDYLDSVRGKKTKPDPIYKK